MTGSHDWKHNPLVSERYEKATGYAPSKSYAVASIRDAVWKLFEAVRSHVEYPEYALIEVDDSEQSRLRSLPYKEYLKTPYWGDVRAAVFAYRGYRCECCHALSERWRILDVHHLNYKRRGAEIPSDLMVLCRSCHKKEHGR